MWNLIITRRNWIIAIIGLSMFFMGVKQLTSPQILALSGLVIWFYASFRQDGHCIENLQARTSKLENIE